MPSDGERLGKYVLAAKLGAGGMGEVWKAWDAELNRWVALKFLKGEDREELARFRREAQTAAGLSHPNIAAVYEAREKFIAMQYIAGQDLTTYPRLDRRKLVSFVRDAARAVHYAHTKGVVHRDVKPANLMVDGEGRLYVMDFGLAKPLAVKSNLSASGMMVGTPAYMSPEQAQGKREVDGRSDVYALGATLYELMEDRPPFRGDDLVELLTQVVTEEAKPLSRGDRELNTIVMKCLEKEPGRRYGSAGALADDLTRYLEGEVIAARPATAAYRLRKFASKRRALTALMVVAMLVVPAAAFIVPAWLKARREAAAAKGWVEEAKLYLPLEKDLAVLREKFYRVDFRMTDEDFTRYEELIGRVREQMRRTGESAYGHYLIGRCWEVVENPGEAEQAYRDGLARDADHPPSLMALGRLLIEKALMTRATFEADRGDEEHAVKGSRERAREGADLVRRGAARAGAGRRMEQDVAEAYVRVIENWGRRAASGAAAKMEEWRRESFVEEFLLLEGLSARSPEPMTQALEKIPSWPKAWFWRAAHQREPGLTIGDLTRALEINPRYEVAHINRTMKRLRAGDVDGAIAGCDEMLRVWPRSAAALNMRGLARVEKGDPEGAIADYDKALRIDPGSALAYHNRATAKATHGDHDGAIADYGEALRINPRFAGAYARRSASRRVNGDVDGALADCEEALRIHAHCAEAYLNRGLTRHKKGDAAGAVADFEEALRIEPDYADAYFGLGDERRDRGDLDGAIAHYERALRIKPRLAIAYVNRGEARHAKGDTEGALADWEKALLIDRRSVMAYFNRGLARYIGGNVDGAIADWDEALRIDPRHADSYVNRGNAKQVKGDVEGAIADYDAALRADPRHAQAYYNRGRVRAAQRDRERAIADYGEAVRINPRYRDAYIARGQTRLARGDSDGAIADYDEAIRIDPRCDLAYFNRAILRSARKDVDGAIADLTEVVRLAPRHYEAYRGRGALRQAAGDRAGARADYEKALEVAPAGWRHRAAVEKELAALQ